MPGSRDGYKYISRMSHEQWLTVWLHGQQLGRNRIGRNMKKYDLEKMYVERLLQMGTNMRILLSHTNVHQTATLEEEILINICIR